MNKAKQKPPSTFSYHKKKFDFILTFAFGLVMALGFAKLISLTSSASDKATTINNLPVYLEWFNGTNTLYLSLVLAGGLGGLLYSILLDGELELPSWSKKNLNNLNPGFLGEIFVGIGGSLIAYTFLPQELKKPGDPGLEITIFVTGLVGGYGGKAILDAALNKVINRIKTADSAKEKAESEAKELEEKKHILDLVNRQIQEGLNFSELSELKEKLTEAAPDIKESAFNRSREARRLGRRSNLYKDQLTRTIPIFDALITADDNNAEYHAQRGIADIYLEPRALDYAISDLTKAIELRGTIIQGTEWEYEFHRAIANIFKLKEKGIKSDEAIPFNKSILEDLLIVDKNKGLKKALDEYVPEAKDPSDIPIEGWFHENQDWVSQQTNGKALLDKIQLSAAAKPVTPTATVTWDREDLVIAPPNTKIKATTKTYLKKQPIESSQLAYNHKKEVPVGTEYKILKHSQGSDGHCLVELDYGQGIWYIWSAHWHLPWEDKVLSSVPQSSKNGSARNAIEQLASTSLLATANTGTLRAAATRSIQGSTTVVKHSEATDKAQPGISQIPQRAIELIKEFEGCEKKIPDGRVQAYPDPNPKTGWRLPTIGYGSTRCPDGSPVKRGQIITMDQAEEYLMYDLDKIRRPALEKIPTWKDMNENQRAALYSFGFNLGIGFYRGSDFTSITKVCDSPQRWKDKEWVKEQFVKYRNPGTNVEAGLRRRREAEAKLFCTPPSTVLHTEESAAQPEKGKAATESSDQVSKVEVVKEIPKILTPKEVVFTWMF